MRVPSRRLLVAFTAFALTAVSAAVSAQTTPAEKPANYGLSLPGIYAVSLLVVVALYLPCRWFAELKQRRTEWWWSYL